MDNRTHILFLIDHLWGIAGAEGALLRTARLLPRDRYRCTIGAFRLGPDPAVLKESPWPVMEFRFDGVLNAQALQTARSLRRFIRTERVDIVHTFLESANLWGGLFAKLSGCPVLVSARRDLGILRTAKHRLAYRLLNPFVDQVQAVSSAVREWAIRTEALDPNKVVTVPNGIEIQKADGANGIGGFRQLLGLSEESRLVLTVSNIRRVKGIDVLIRAAKQVCHDYPQTVFLIAGAVHERDHYAELKRLTEEFDITYNIRFLGECSNIRALLHSCEMFCLLSRSEGMSNSLLEAMACGLPCVVTAVGGNSEVIDDGSNGYLVPNENPESAADRLMTLLSNAELARKLGRSARRTVEEKFSAERIVGDMSAMYDQLLRTRGLAKSSSPAECATV